MKKLIVKLGICIVVTFAACYFFCHIKPATEYGWLAAIWHGLFLIPNLVMHCINSDVLFYSELPTTSYKIFFIIGFILNSLIKEVIELISQAVNEISRQD